MVVAVRPRALPRAEVGVLGLPSGKGGAAPEAVRVGVLFEFGHICKLHSSTPKSRGKLSTRYPHYNAGVLSLGAN